MPVNLKGRSFLTLRDYAPQEIRYLLDLSHDLKRKKRAGIPGDLLRGRNIVLLFEKTSTRTRCATRSPRTCSTAGPTCAPSRSCSATRACRRPSATPRSRGTGSRRSTTRPIPARRSRPHTCRCATTDQRSRARAAGVGSAAGAVRHRWRLARGRLICQGESIPVLGMAFPASKTPFRGPKWPSPVSEMPFRGPKWPSPPRNRRFEDRDGLPRVRKRRFEDGNGPPEMASAPAMI